jgi:hypothetical protein
MDKGAKKKLNPTIKSSLIYTKPNRKNKTKINTYIKSSLTCRETCFPSGRYSTYFFFSSSILDHHVGHPARHDAQILLYECIFDAL